MIFFTGEVDVIYAKVSPSDGSDKLQLLCESLVDAFVQAGLMTRQYERVKIHLTLVNTLFRKDSAGIAENELRRGERPRESLDARAVMEIFGERDFCQAEIGEVHLSQRRAGRRTKENYYWPSATIKTTG